MRALCVLGVFSEDSPDRFAMAAIGDHLRRDHPRSFRSAVLFLAGSFRWQLWSDLLESIRTGETYPAAFRLRHLRILRRASDRAGDR